MEKEFVVYIHGITSESEGYNHQDQYDELHKGVTDEIASNSSWRDAHRCKTEWGWNFDHQQSANSHRVLSDAQAQLTKRVLEQVKKASDFTLNPLRCVLAPMRKLMLYGFSDMFYYVSTEGKNAIRTSICEQMAKEIEPYLIGDDTRVSITFVGHSAGSVIAIDLCYYLFSGKVYSFIDEESSDETKRIISDLKNLADRENIRLRRLITLGSPISLLACRKDAVVELLAKGRKINPALHGIVPNEKFASLRGPRWLNIWDKDDPIALPIEPLMENNKKSVEDILVRVSSSIMKVHNLYWSSSKVHRVIADRW